MLLSILELSRRVRNLSQQTLQYYKLTDCQITARKSYFPGPGISWKAEKDQVNIIFPSPFCLTKRPSL